MEKRTQFRLTLSDRKPWVTPKEGIQKVINSVMDDQLKLKDVPTSLLEAERYQTIFSAQALREIVDGYSTSLSVVVKELFSHVYTSPHVAMKYNKKGEIKISSLWVRDKKVPLSKINDPVRAMLVSLNASLLKIAYEYFRRQKGEKWDGEFHKHFPAFLEETGLNKDLFKTIIRKKPCDSHDFRNPTINDINRSFQSYEDLLGIFLYLYGLAVEPEEVDKEVREDAAHKVFQLTLSNEELLKMMETDKEFKKLLIMGVSHIIGSTLKRDHYLARSPQLSKKSWWIDDWNEDRIYYYLRDDFEAQLRARLSAPCREEYIRRQFRIYRWSERRHWGYKDKFIVKDDLDSSFFLEKEEK